MFSDFKTAWMGLANSKEYVSEFKTAWMGLANSNEYVSEFKTAWMGLANSKEQYVLKYESKYLLQMGTAMDYLVAIAINAATQEALKYTILSGE